MTKSEQLYNDLKNRVIDCEPDSQFLSVRAIMQDFDVSQATVSTAIQKLTDEGLLRKNGRRGMAVTDTILRYRQTAKPVYCLALPLWASEYYGMLEERFSEYMEKHGHALEIVRYSPRLRIPDRLPSFKIDGLVVVSAQLTLEDLRKLDALDLPYLIFGQPLTGIDVNSVCHDEEYTGMLAAHHLWELGHRKLAVVVSEPESAVTLGRVEGFRKFAELHDCAVEVIDYLAIQSGEFAPERIYRSLRDRYRAAPPGHSGIFVISECGSYAVCRACHECGIRIPEDVSVITCGENWILQYMHPALTSIGSDHRALVAEAVDLLRASAKTGRTEQRTTKAQLSVRASTARKT